MKSLNENNKIYYLSSSYNELSEFREENSLNKNCSSNQLYNEVRSRVTKYKIIFFLFSVLFLAIGAYIYIKTPVFFMNFLKPLTAITSVTFGLLALWISHTITLQKEATKQLYIKACIKLKIIEAAKLAHLPPKDFWQMWRDRLQLNRQTRKIRHELRHEELETLHLMGNIQRATHLEIDEKNTLFNQALLELQDKFNFILNDFKKVV